MRGLVRAEWLRLRRRRDIWFVCLAVLALSIVAYASGLSSVQTMFFMPPGEDVPPEVLEDMRFQMEAEIARYAFPQSIGTVLTNAQMLLLALLAYLAAALTGAEFSYGTIRTSLVADPDRRGFVAIRLAALGLVAVAVIVLLVVIGAVLPFVAELFGQRWTAAAATPQPSVPGGVGALLLASAFVIGATTMFAVSLHNAALALVLTVAAVLVDGVLHGLIVRLSGGDEGALLAWALPVSDLQLLFTRAQGNQLAPEVPTGVAVGVALAWIAALWVASIRLMAVADVRD